MNPARDVLFLAKTAQGYLPIPEATEELGLLLAPRVTVPGATNTNPVLTTQKVKNDSYSRHNHNIHVDACITKQWRWVFPATLFVYCLLQYWMGTRPVCTFHGTYDLPQWVWCVNLFVVLSFGVAIVAHLVQLLFKTSRLQSETSAMLCASMTILFTAGSSSLLTLTTSWGGLCLDGFGVPSPAAQWAEWGCSVPLLLYMTMSCDISKKRLDCSEVGVIFSFLVAILMGFLLVLGFPKSWNIAFLAISILMVASTIHLASRAKSDLESQIVDIEHAPEFRTSRDTIGAQVESLHTQFLQLQFGLKRRNLSIVCLVGMPLFPAIYFLCLTKIISIDVSYALTLVAGMSVKCFMTSLLTLDQMAIFHEMSFDEAEDLMHHRIHMASQALAFANHKYYNVQFRPQ